MFHVESRHIMLIYCNLSLSFLLNHNKHTPSNHLSEPNSFSLYYLIHITLPKLALFIENFLLKSAFPHIFSYYFLLLPYNINIIL